MKKTFTLFIALVMVFSLAACNSVTVEVEEEKPFDKSKEAYDKITVAYEITDQFSSDVYEAWRLGIYDDEEIIDDGVSHLASELSLSEAELTAGFAYFLATTVYEEDWDSLTTAEKVDFEDKVQVAFKVFEDDLFSYCIQGVTSAYKVNGKEAEAQAALDEAKTIMKDLSDKHSDYEHYPNLKGYYTTTKSFFEFCVDPEGSFEQVKDTINDYRNEARDYLSDLDYIFEE